MNTLSRTKIAPMKEKRKRILPLLIVLYLFEEKQLGRAKQLLARPTKRLGIQNKLVVPFRKKEYACT